MTIMVLGGDGFFGWPTALHLSDVGHKVEMALSKKPTITAIKSKRADQKFAKCDMIF